MFSDAIADDTILDPATQEQFASSSCPPAVVSASPGLARPASVSAAPRSPATTAPTTIKPTVIALISKAELERIRQHNRILRSNNVSIFQQRNEMEARAVAAEQRAQQLNQRCALEQAGRLRAEEAIRRGDRLVARLHRELQAESETRERRDEPPAGKRARRDKI